MPVALPIDLFFPIIEHLDGDREALRACCLASRTLKEIAQPVLWRHVRMVDRFIDASDPVKEWALSHAPSLGAHVGSGMTTRFSSPTCAQTLAIEGLMDNREGFFPVLRPKLLDQLDMLEIRFYDSLALVQP
ncbi:hypothetical protein JCM6882_004990 [Rhodosporidiobolus microsporus]